MDSVTKLDVNEKYCSSCGKPIKTAAVICPNCGVKNTNLKSERNKVVAGLLGIFLGGLGIHKFYLGKTGAGIVYLVFFWTFIPAIVGFIEGIMYLTSSDEKFNLKYNS